MLVDDRSAKAFFQPEAKLVNGVEHLVVGVQHLPSSTSGNSGIGGAFSGPSSPSAGSSSSSSSSSSGAGNGARASPGVRDVHALRTFLMDGARLSLEASMGQAKLFRTASFKGGSFMQAP